MAEKFKFMFLSIFRRLTDKIYYRNIFFKSNQELKNDFCRKKKLRVYKYLNK